MIQTKVGSNILLSQDFLFQKFMLQILDLEAELFEDEIDKDLEHHFRKLGWGVKGRLEIFRKFIRFGI